MPPSCSMRKVLHLSKPTCPAAGFRITNETPRPIFLGICPIAGPRGGEVEQWASVGLLASCPGWRSVLRGRLGG